VVIERSLPSSRGDRPRAPQPVNATNARSWRHSFDRMRCQPEACFADARRRIYYRHCRRSMPWGRFLSEDRCHEGNATRRLAAIEWHWISRCRGIGRGRRKTGRLERRQNMNWQDRVSVNPRVCHGKPCIKGTRVMVSVVLADVAAGESFDAIMSGYHIEREDIQAALHFAAEMAQDRYVPVPELT
jgi:uncharacterized protein (DUF433 family)